MSGSGAALAAWQAVVGELVHLERQGSVGNVTDQRLGARGQRGRLVGIVVRRGGLLVAA